jgi:hypothetical protein
MLLENEVNNAEKCAWRSVFGLPVLMCVEYISVMKVATSYKFLFVGFLSIKYSAKWHFSQLALLLFLSLCILFKINAIAVLCVCANASKSGETGLMSLTFYLFA